MMDPLVLDLAGDGVPVAVTCRVLGFSKQAFYAWRKNPVTQRDWDDAHLINTALVVHADDPEFGYRFIADEIAEHGIRAGENRVQRLCPQRRIWSLHANKRGLNRTAGPPVHDDLVDRQFSADRPNRTWLTDITEHRTDEGKLYLCAIKDVHSNKIVGYSIDCRMKASLAVAALRNAIALRQPAGTVVHPDRGSQGGFNRSSQHLDRGGADGQAGGLDEGVDGALGYEVAGGAVVSAGGRARVLACDRHRYHQRGGRGRRRRVAGGRQPVVPPTWRHALDRSRSTFGSLSVVSRARRDRHRTGARCGCQRDRSPTGS